MLLRDEASVDRAEGHQAVEDGEGEPQLRRALVHHEQDGVADRFEDDEEQEDLDAPQRPGATEDGLPVAVQIHQRPANFFRSIGATVVMTAVETEQSVTRPEPFR